MMIPTTEQLLKKERVPQTSRDTLHETIGVPPSAEWPLTSAQIPISTRVSLHIGCYINDKGDTKLCPLMLKDVKSFKLRSYLDRHLS